MSDEGVRFIVDLDGFEGPLDLLLDLARAQKVDLRKISILTLAEQYLLYLEDMRVRKLEVAAEYLVMAAWLAYLKSKLLLPPPDCEADDVQKLASELKDRLRRREALARAITWLESRPMLGRERFVRGAEDPAPVEVCPRWVGSLSDLLSSYGRMMRRREQVVVRLPQRREFTIEAALDRISRMLTGRDWLSLASFLPDGLRHELERRAALVASFVASLELARTGAVELQQAAPFGPIRLRRTS